ncbi:tetratricopeptide repeat protein [Pleionea sp. CnH1-48]|uniref:tetratricopeptide repeat protein n=1 Tax=Pleionea sp. CnH1-48 TaxID=2954494 RepID=UPI00209684E8|nr:tetratricopeptide repeat protein [Pleionea sp. CnH1-48]MCO7225878.1 tetratricopeptide repeat protein [Pleionea sp. CnH1-48]
MRFLITIYLLTSLNWLYANTDNSIADCKKALTKSRLAQGLEICQAKLEQTSAQTHPKIWVELNVALSDAYRRQGQYAKAKNYLEVITHLEQFEKDNELQYLVTRRLGILAYREGQFIDAQHHFNQGLQLAKQQENEEWLANSYNDLGNVYRQLGDFEQSLSAFYQSLQKKEALGLEQKVAVTLNNIGNVFRIMEDDDKALEYYQRALQKYLLQDDKSRIAHTQENIALLHAANQQFDKAEALMKKSNALYKSLPSLADSSRLMTQLSELYVDYGYLDKAFATLRITQNQVATLANAHLQGALNIVFAKAYIKQQQFDEAKRYLESTLTANTQHENREQLLKAYPLLIQVLKAQGLLEESLQRSEEYQVIYKAQLEASYNKQIAQLSNRLELREKENTIRTLEQENRIHNLHLEQQRWLMLSVVLGATLALSFVAWYFHRRNQQRAFESQQKLNELQHQVDYHKEAEHQLRTTQQRLQFMLDTSNEALMALDVSGQVLFVNHSLCELTGYSFEELVQQELSHWLKHDKQTGLIPEDSDPQHIEQLNIQHKQQQELACEAWLTPVELEQQIWVLTLCELNQKKSAQSPVFLQQLNAGKKALTRLNELLAQATPENFTIDASIKDEMTTIEQSLEKLNKRVQPDSLQQNFRADLVDLMFSCVSLWEQTTNTTRIELAEQSGIWRVTVDDGRLRTRAMDRYLNLDKLPKQPRWREVVRTGHFILSHCELPDDDRSRLKHKLDEFMQSVRTRSLA